jgi:hypothetical protein
MNVDEFSSSTRFQSHKNCSKFYQTPHLQSKLHMHFNSQSLRDQWNIRDSHHQTLFILNNDHINDSNAGIWDSEKVFYVF